VLLLQRTQGGITQSAAFIQQASKTHPSATIPPHQSLTHKEKEEQIDSETIRGETAAHRRSSTHT